MQFIVEERNFIMRFSLRGVTVPHRKNTSSAPSVIMPFPSVVTIPLSMHVGKCAIPCVKKGDEVFVGTLIAEQNGFISASVHSSVSGRVLEISEVLLPSGVKCSAVKIESDGKTTLDPSIMPPRVTDRASFAQAIRNSGIVGLGGAAFPTYVKLNVPEGKRVDALIINAAECEPYITSDTRTIIENSDDMYDGISAVCKFLEIENVIIGIEDNNPEAIAKIKELLERDSKIKLAVLQRVYPQGAEKVLVYHTTGKVIPAGKLPLDVGVIVLNCSTACAIGSYLKTGIPLVSKRVTVDGGSISEPKNIIAPIGASVEDVIAFAGGFKSEPYTVVLGGPMMGNAIEDLKAPIMKGTNAVLAFTQKEAKPKRETACIHCGACVNHCPYFLNPRAYMYAYVRGDVETLTRLRVDICMECGCCSFVCPAGKPLVETNKLSKAKVKEYLAEKKAK